MLLDTNVLSELLRAKPNAAVLAWFATQAADRLCTSAITQAEMRLGVRLLPAGKRRQQLGQALEAMFSLDFVGRVLAFDTHCSVAYAEVVAQRRSLGRPIAQFDAQIAAVALCHGLPLATRNTADFDGCGLTLANPWAPV